MGENGSYEKAVRPITRQVMESDEERFGKPASEEHKWAMFGLQLCMSHYSFTILVLPS